MDKNTYEIRFCELTSASQGATPFGVDRGSLALLHGLKAVFAHSQEASALRHVAIETRKLIP